MILLEFLSCIFEFLSCIFEFLPCVVEFYLVLHLSFILEFFSCVHSALYIYICTVNIYTIYPVGRGGSISS